MSPGVHGDHVVPGCRLDDALRAVDRNTGKPLRTVEVIGRPVVGVLVGEDDADDLAEVDEGSGVGPRIDDQGLARLVQSEGGMLEFVTRMV